MDKIRHLRTFACLSQNKSFSLTARQMNLSRSAVTKAVTQLEESLGARLISRSTHHFALTEAGELLADEALVITERLDRLREKIEAQRFEMSGRIRVGAPAAVGAAQIYKPLLNFAEKYPSISVELYSDDGTINVVKEGLDFSIRVATALPDTDLKARILAVIPQIFVASPAYVDRYGMPMKPDDLIDHECLVYFVDVPKRRWVLNGVEVPIRGRFCSELAAALINAARQGAGISMHPPYLVGDDIKAGSLVRVLPDFEGEPLSVFAVFPERQLRPKRVTEILDLLKEWMSDQIDWYL